MSISLDQLTAYVGLRGWSPLTKVPVKNNLLYQFTVASEDHKYIVRTSFEGDVLTSVNLDTGVDLAPWGGLDPFFSKDGADSRDLVVSAFGYGRYNFKSKEAPQSVSDLEAVIDAAIICADALLEEIDSAQGIIMHDRRLRQLGAPWAPK